MGLKSVKKVFCFGNNGLLKALFAVEILIWLYRKKAALPSSVVAGQTPLLLSRHTPGSMLATIGGEITS